MFYTVDKRYRKGDEKPVVYHTIKSALTDSCTIHTPLLIPNLEEVKDSYIVYTFSDKHLLQIESIIKRALFFLTDHNMM